MLSGQGGENTIHSGTSVSHEEYVAPGEELQQLLATVAILRSPGGCPWDAEQSHESLVRYLIEETFEVVSAIETGDDEELVEELGDLLYQIVFHASIAEGRGSFRFADVAKGVAQKMVKRHPHVFDEGLAGTKNLETVILDWEAIKRAEKSERTSRLDGVPRAMPALLLADKLFGKVRDIAHVLPADTVTVDTEIFEDEEALGEALFATVLAAKQQGFDAERALRLRLAKFMEEIETAEMGMN